MSSGVLNEKTSLEIQKVIEKIEAHRRTEMSQKGTEVDKALVLQGVSEFYKSQDINIDIALIEEKVNTVTTSAVSKEVGKDSFFKFGVPVFQFFENSKSKDRRRFNELMFRHKPFSIDELTLLHDHQDEKGFSLDLMRGGIVAAYLLSILGVIGLSLWSSIHGGVLALIGVALASSSFGAYRVFKVLTDRINILRLNPLNPKRKVLLTKLYVPILKNLPCSFSANGGQKVIDIRDRFGDVKQLFEKADPNHYLIEKYISNFDMLLDTKLIYEMWKLNETDSKPIRNIDCFLLNHYFLLNYNDSSIDVKTDGVF